MWLLKDSNGKIKYLKTNENFTVGRKTGSLVVSDDSVSRNHAVITVDAKKDITQIKNNAEPLSTCTIKDTGSKYGSYILRDGKPELRISAQGIELRHLDKIRFGVQQSIYAVIYVPVITAMSGLDSNEKGELRDIIHEIGGNIIPSWETVSTHMTISKPNISEKLTCALAYGTPIVPMDFWRDALRAYSSNETLPDFAGYAGTIDARLGLLGNISVRPDPRRKSLFRDLTFVHYDSGQYNVHRRMIETAGGTSILWRNQTRKDINVCDDNVVVVQMIESNTTQATGTGDANYTAACEQLGHSGRRAIPAGEIALAIFHCSTRKCCNPRYDHVGMFKKRNHAQPQKSSILALDTQDDDPLPPCDQVVRCEKLPCIEESASLNDFIKESSDQPSQMESQSAATKASPDASTSQFDEASLKVASFNYEKYASLEGNAIDDVNTNRMKRVREREGAEDCGTKNKRICARTPLNFNDRKPEATTMNAVEARVDAILDDTAKDSMVKKQIFKRPLAAESKVSPEEKTAKFDVLSVGTSATRQQTSPRITDKNAASLLSRDTTKSPLKKPRGSPKKMRLFDSPERGQTTLTKFLSPQKKVTAKTERTSMGKCPQERQRDPVTPNAKPKWADVSSKSYSAKPNKKSYELDTTELRLLRVESPTDSAAVSKLGKSFSKRCTMTVHRIEFQNFMDEHSSRQNQSVKEKRVSPNEGVAVRSHKISPSSVKRTLRA